MKKTPSLLSGSMIIAGSAVGAGMLANPTATSGVWFLGSIVLLIVLWLLMLTTGLFVLEANTHFDTTANLHSMVKDLLGKKASVLLIILYAFALYLVLYAYVTVAGGATANALGALFKVDKFPLTVGQVVFAVVFTFFVWVSAIFVGHVATLLVLVMIAVFLYSLFVLGGTAKAEFLFNVGDTPPGLLLAFAAIAIPVIVTSFIFHTNVAGMFKYFNGDTKKVKIALITGSLMSFIFYTLWQFMVHGNLPRNAFGPVIAADGNVQVLLGEIAKYVNVHGVGTALTIFAFCAIASSFIGVGLGLLDYFIDLFKLKENVKNRSLITLLTFGPPFFASVIAPTGFVTAIGYVGILGVVWSIIYPSAMVLVARRKFAGATGYKVCGGTNALPVIIILIAILIIVLQLLILGNVLPTFKG